MTTSDQIRKLARLLPMHEEHLDQISGDAIINHTEVESGGFEYFWRPRTTEVQEAHSYHVDGKAEDHEEDLIDSIETLPDFSHLRQLAQDVVPKHSIDPTDVKVPDLKE
jgi:hypothetical protein